MADVVPDWSFAFAGTIHGEGAHVRESVHLLASPGMTRQVLAAGVAAHREDIRIVVPSSAKRTGEVLTRIVQREGGAESVLDYGFDPSFGAREAMRGRSFETLPEEGGIEVSVDRLAALAGIERAARAPALGQGLEGEVLAEVIGAAILRDGQAPEGRERLALERYVQSLSDGRSWRRLLKQVPATLPAQADHLARSEAGVDGAGQLLTPARVLARGALAARALGEERIAGMFEAGLMLYGQRVEMARTHGRVEELVPEQAADRPAPNWPDPTDRPLTPAAEKRAGERAETKRVRAPSWASETGSLRWDRSIRRSAGAGLS